MWKKPGCDRLGLCQAPSGVFPGPRVPRAQCEASRVPQPGNSEPAKTARLQFSSTMLASPQVLRAPDAARPALRPPRGRGEDPPRCGRATRWPRALTQVVGSPSRLARAQTQPATRPLPAHARSQVPCRAPLGHASDPDLSGRRYVPTLPHTLPPRPARALAAPGQHVASWEMPRGRRNGLSRCNPKIGRGVALLVGWFECFHFLSPFYEAAL